MIKIKFFLDPISSIEPWLNSISSRGYRLVSVKNFIYKFEKTNLSYSYSTVFIGANTVRENKKLVNFLEDSEVKTFRAPLNQGNIAFGKFRFRPYVKGRSKISSTFGDYNKEILIVETKGETPEKFFTLNEDIAKEYKSIRNAYLQGFIVLLFLVGILYINNSEKSIGANLIIKEITAISLSIFLLTIVITAHRNYKRYESLSKILEEGEK